MNFIKEHPLEFKIGVPIIVLGTILIRWAYCVSENSEAGFCQNILSSLGTNFLVLGITILFVDMAIKSNEDKKYIHKRVDLYEKIKQILFHVDQIFLAIDYGAHYQSMDIDNRLPYDYEQIKQTLVDLVAERKNLNNYSGTDKQDRIKISNSVDVVIIRLCDETKDLLAQVNYIDVTDLDNDIVRKLRHTIENSFIKYFSTWYNMWHDADNYNSCIYTNISNYPDLKKTIDNINEISILADKMFKELSRDKRFSYLYPPVFTNVVT